MSGNPQKGLSDVDEVFESAYSQLMRERILGPINGYFIVVGCLIMGVLGQRYRGWGKVFADLPQTLLAPGELHSVETSSDYAWPEAAMDAAEDLLVDHVNSLPTRASSGQHRPLYRLLYVSRSVEAVSLQQFQDILQVARARNAARGLTGMLLYLDETYIQYLEGPENELFVVYRSIRKDPRHTGLIKVLAQPIERRTFPEWSMAFDTPGAELWLSPQLRQGPALTEALSDSAVHGLLSAFYHRASVRAEILTHAR